MSIDTSSTTSEKRRYRRRSDDERIEELETRIRELQAKVEAKKRQDEPILKDIPRLQKRLRKFSQLAFDHGRHDIANSAVAFATSLSRYHDEAYGPKATEHPEGEEPTADAAS